MRVAQHSPQPRVIEAFPQMGNAPPPPRRGFWKVTLLAIPIVVALASTSLLAYFMFFTERSQPVAQQSQPEPQVRREQAEAEPPREVAQDNTQSQPAQQPPQPQPIPTDLGPRLSMPSDDKLVILINSSLLALNQANATGNYAVLRELAAPAFQQINSPERLAEIFEPLRARNLDLSPIVLYQVKLIRAPEMNAQGMIRLVGYYPTEPERVNFELIYQPVHSKWRLFGIAVETSPAPVRPSATTPQSSDANAAKDATAEVKPQSEVTDEVKPPAPARKAKEKPKTAQEAVGTTEKVDVRDRLDSPPPAPQPARPKQKERSGWNPFGR